MLYKVLGGFIMLAAGILAFLIIQGDPKLAGKFGSVIPQKDCVQLTPAEQLIQLIDEDISQLGKNGQLPKQWNSIGTVEYRMGSELAKALLGKAKPGIQRVKEGTHYLEVEVLDMPDDKDPGIILQMSLFDIKSKNKIFELGRTYTMNQLNKQPEEKAAAPNAQPSASATPAASTAKPATQSAAPQDKQQQVPAKQNSRK